MTSKYIKSLAKYIVEDRLNEFAPSGSPPNMPPGNKPPKDYWGDGDGDDKGDGDHPTDYFYLTQSYSKMSKDLFNSIGSKDPVYGINDPEDIERYTEIYKNKPKMDHLAQLFQDGGVGAGLKYFITLPEVVQDYLGTAWDDHGLDWEKDCKKFGLLESKAIEESSDIDQKIESLQYALGKVRNSTKAIKYDDTITNIIVEVQEIARSLGIDEKEFNYEINAIHNAKNELESAVYSLEDIFKDKLYRLETEKEESELDENAESDSLTDWQYKELEHAIKSRGFRSNVDDKAVQDVINSLYASHSISSKQIGMAKEFLYDYMDNAVQNADDLYEGGMGGINRCAPAQDVSYEHMLDEILQNELDEMDVDTLKDYRAAATDPENIRHRPLRKLAKTVRGVKTADRKIRAKTGDRTQGPVPTYEERLSKFL